MKFEPAKGIKGKIFIPEYSGASGRKHSCADCFHCQNCSDDRCEICIGKEELSGKMPEQKKRTITG